VILWIYIYWIFYGTTMFEENGVKMHRNNFEGLKWSEDLPGGKKERDHCLWFSSSLLIVPIKSIKCLEMDLVGLLSMQFFSLLFFCLGVAKGAWHTRCHLEHSTSFLVCVFILGPIFSFSFTIFLCRNNNTIEYFLEITFYNWISWTPSIWIITPFHNTDADLTYVLIMSLFFLSFSPLVHRDYNNINI
jgi:hypothetical protein